MTRLLGILPLALDERIATAGMYIGLPHPTLIDLISSFTSNAIAYVILALGMSFLYGLSFVALGRRRWIAYAAWLLFLGGMGFLPGLAINNTRPGATLLTSIFSALGWALWLFILQRLGILAFLVMATTASLLAEALPTLDFSVWYASSTSAGLMLFFALAAYAFYRCVAWRGGLADALVGD